jgi:spore coat protein CotH
MTMNCARSWVGLLIVCGIVLPGARVLGADQGPTKSAQLFDQDKVWNIHLSFTAEQWQAIEPGRRPNQFPQSRPAPPKFDLGRAITPTFLVQGDTNRDGQLSATEFASLSEKWFAAWDKQNTGVLTAAELRDGINISFAGTRGPGPRFNPIGISLQGPQGRRNGLASAFGIDFPTVHADLQFENITLKDVAVRYKGNGTFVESRNSLKRSFKVELNKFVKGQKLAEVVTLNLHNCVTDASYMNEVLSHRLFHDAGIAAPRTAYARVYVTVPGKHDHRYFGLYSLVENVDAHFAADRFGKHGEIFKPVTHELFGDLGDDWKNYVQTYDAKTSLSAADAQHMIDLCKLATYADDAQFAARISDYLELDEFASFMAICVYLSDLDGILGPGQNFYLHLHPKTHKLAFIPWDQDHSFGTFAMVGNQAQREQLSINHPWRLDNRLLDRLFKTDAFKKRYLAKLETFSTTLFKPERFVKQVDEIAAAIRDAVKEEGEEKSAAFEKSVAGQGKPTGAFSFLTGEAIKPIKTFVVVRTQSILDQLADKSKGQIPDQRAMRTTPPADLFAPAPALDKNNDGQITREEFTTAFAAWFKSWDADADGMLSARELQAGINQMFAAKKPD